MTIILSIFFLVLAAVSVYFIVKLMLKKACPECIQDQTEHLIIPFIPGFKWYCMGCGKILSNSELISYGSQSSKTSSLKVKQDQPEVFSSEAEQRKARRLQREANLPQHHYVDDDDLEKPTFF